MQSSAALQTMRRVKCGRQVLRVEASQIEADHAGCFLRFRGPINNDSFNAFQSAAQAACEQPDMLLDRCQTPLQLPIRGGCQPHQAGHIQVASLVALGHGIRLAVQFALRAGTAVSQRA